MRFRLSVTQAVLRAEECSYTGHIAGMGEVYAKTPIACQLECAEPAAESFIFTRKLVPPRAMPDRDPCNRPEDALKPQPSTLSTAQKNQ